MNGKLSVNISGDKKISVALMSFFVLLPIQYFFLVSFDLMNTPTGSYIQTASKVLSACAYMYALPTVLRRNKNIFIKAYFFGVLVFLGSYLFFSDNRHHINTMLFPFFFMSLPAFVYSTSLKDLAVFKSIIYKAAHIVFVVCTFLGILLLSGKADIGTYSMAFSYYMLFPAIIYFNIFFERLSLKYLLMFMVALFNILSLGARGPLLCVAVFIILKIAEKLKSTTYDKMLFNIVIINALVVVSLFLNRMAEYLYNFLLTFDINARSLLLLSRSSVHLSGRDRIYDAVFDAIRKSPFFGIGIGGDRAATAGGIYVHNIFVEIMANFGVVAGTAVFLGLLFVIIKILADKTGIGYTMAAIWMSLGFVHLMISSSYLIDIKFWIFMGIAFNILFFQKPESENISDERDL